GGVVKARGTRVAHFGTGRGKGRPGGKEALQFEAGPAGLEGDASERHLFSFRGRRVRCGFLPSDTITERISGAREDPARLALRNPAPHHDPHHDPAQPALRPPERAALACGGRRLVVLAWAGASFFPNPSSAGNLRFDALRLRALEHHRTFLGITDRLPHGYRGSRRNCNDQLDWEPWRTGGAGDPGILAVFQRLLWDGHAGSGGAGGPERPPAGIAAAGGSPRPRARKAARGKVLVSCGRSSAGFVGHAILPAAAFQSSELFRQEESSKGFRMGDLRGWSTLGPKRRRGRRL